MLSWTFPHQEMPSEIKAVTDAHGGRGTGGAALDVVLVDLLRWSSAGSSTQQNVALSTGERVNLGHNCAAHGSEVRSATMEQALTLKVVCETDASAARAVAARRWPRVSIGCAFVVAATVVRRRRGESSS